MTKFNSELDKMTAGQLYDLSDEDRVALWQAARQKLVLFNQELDSHKRDEVLKSLGTTSILKLDSPVIIVRISLWAKNFSRILIVPF